MPVFVNTHQDAEVTQTWALIVDLYSEFKYNATAPNERGKSNQVVKRVAPSGLLAYIVLFKYMK
jgi:hypothetical protein